MRLMTPYVYTYFEMKGLADSLTRRYDLSRLYKIQ
jgi:hypothetical protein